MACTGYDKLVQNWRLLVYERPGDDVTVAAYWNSVEHRIFCEVCGDESLVEGCFAVYRVVAPSVLSQARRHSI
jgi:hypothetical protein